MKKVRLTIKTERTFDFEFNETILDEKFIKNWSKSITDITDEPESFGCIERDIVPESMYPYVNLAESIAYAIHVNDDDHIECLQFQDMTECEWFSKEKDPEIPVYFKRIGYLETEYELDIDETDTEDE